MLIISLALHCVKAGVLFFVPLHSLRYSPIYKAVQALALCLGVGFYYILLTFGDQQIHPVIRRRNVLILFCSRIFAAAFNTHKITSS